jgi:hypothetical protein
MKKCKKRFKKNNFPVKKPFLPREKVPGNTVHHVYYITFSSTVVVTEYAGSQWDKTIIARGTLSYGQ